MHRPKNGHKNGRNMQKAYYVLNINTFIQLCASVGFIILSNLLQSALQLLVGFGLIILSNEYINSLLIN
jgi:hypothetical protein